MIRVERLLRLEDILRVEDIIVVLEAYLLLLTIVHRVIDSHLLISGSLGCLLGGRWATKVWKLKRG